MPDERLAALARLHGVETTLPDRTGKPQTVSARVLKGVLAALGVPAATEAEVARAIADHELGRWREVLPPVDRARHWPMPSVAWRCERFVLAESRRGAPYSVVGEWPLYRR